MTRHSTRLAFAVLLAGIALSAPAAPALAQPDTGKTGEGQATASGCAEQIKMPDELVRQSGLDSKAGEKAATDLSAAQELLECAREHDCLKLLQPYKFHRARLR